MRGMKRSSILWALLLGVSCRGSCQPPPPSNACESISIPPIPPGKGNLAICTTATDCREDVMSGLISSAFCSDKSGATCPAQSAACSSACAGTVLGSGITLAPGACSWDRNSECKTSSGADGKNCSCAWEIPAGSTLSCGCACH